MFKFLHTADIHLDSPLLNLDKYDDAPRDEFRSATRRAFDNIVELAIRESVNFVIIAGDLYDGDCSDFHTPRHFRRQMKRLGEHGVRVYIIQGNHDAANKMRKAFRLEMPDNVHLFSTARPETKRIDELAVAIHGQGFAKREVTDDLSQMYPDAVTDCVNIGILHTSCGAHDQHDTYAPSTVQGLTAKGYDYWALGHIHMHEVLSEANPWIVYSGNPQGRSVRETGARGCVVATYDGERISIKRHDVDVMRWSHLRIDAEDCDDVAGVQSKLRERITEELATAGDHPLAARIELVGATRAHADLVRQSDYWDRQIREQVLDQFDEQVWIEKIKFHTRGHVTKTNQLDSALGEFMEQLNQSSLAETSFADLQADFDKMLLAIPTDPRVPPGEVDTSDLAVMESLISGARDLLVNRLLNPEHHR